MTYIERLHLEIIDAVEKEGSMTAAAARLNLTQSALSHSIRRLEDVLGVKIWHREGRNLRPTQAGLYLLSRAQRLLPQFTAIEQQLQEFSDGNRGTLRVGMECHPCYKWLQKIAPAFLNEWLNVDLDVIQKFKFGGVGALYNDEIDVLITPDPVEQKGLKFLPVFDYEQVLIVSESHKFSQEKYVTPSMLRDETVIAYPISKDRLDIYKDFLTPAGVIPKRHKTIETTEIILQMVECGRGIAALPEWLVKELMQEYKISPVRMGKQGVAKKLYLGLRSSDLEVEYIQAFLKLALQHKPS